MAHQKFVQVTACWKFLPHNDLVGDCKGLHVRQTAKNPHIDGNTTFGRNVRKTLADPVDRAAKRIVSLSRGGQQALIYYNLNDTACAVMGQSFFLDTL